MTLGEAIRLIRVQGNEYHGLRTFAARLGVSHVHLCNVEHGRTGASVDLLNKIYEVSGFHPSLLVLLHDGVDIDRHTELLTYK